MGVFEMITSVAIAAMAFTAFIYWRHTGGKIDKESIKALFGDSNEWDDMMGGSSKKVKSLEAEVVALKERVATLESIVTDSKYQLDKEIANLK